MEANRSGARITAAVIWGIVALLLWTASRLLYGNVQAEGPWVERNAELAALFAQADGIEPPPAKQTEPVKPAVQPPKTGAAGGAPSSGKTVPEPAAELAANGSAIDLNRATEAELVKLPGIGPSKAKAIVQYREQQGAFRTIEELKKVKGIGDKTFEKLKPLITANP